MSDRGSGADSGQMGSTSAPDHKGQLQATSTSASDTKIIILSYEKLIIKTGTDLLAFLFCFYKNTGTSILSNNQIQIILKGRIRKKKNYPDPHNG